MFVSVTMALHGARKSRICCVQVCMIAPKGLNCGCEDYVVPAGAVIASTDTGIVGIVSNQSALTAAVASPPPLVGAVQNFTSGGTGLQRARSCPFLCLLTVPGLPGALRTADCSAGQQ